MHKLRYIFIFCGVLISMKGISQNLHYFFIDNAYQRSYFNPALNDDHTFSFASGLGADLYTNGPSLSEITTENPTGGLIISTADAIANMNEFNDIFASTTVNTFDASVNTPFFRVSVGHAWKAQGWLEYPRDLAELITKGNGAFIGQTLNLAPQIDYLNYNEVYLGFQKTFGPLSVGLRLKRLSGVETIRTNSSVIDLTTSDDIYQITIESDFELNSSRAFEYTDIETVDFDIDNFSFDNFFKNNGGWALDIGGSLAVGESLELSLGIIDIGSIGWDVDPKTYTSKKVQTFDGIDISDYITSDEEFVILDSIEALLDLTETNEKFSTTLPAKIYLGGTLTISDLWSVGGLIQSNGSGDRRSNVLALNATARVFKFLSIGGMYSMKQGNPANIGVFGSLNVGPVTAFLSTDNILKFGSFDSKNINLQAGLSIQI
ncbi:MAG: DUF5723 family protein [Saprospiraceae bacterium]|nr:DUF5723 family protein [Saprospiraceae bacterium]